MRLPLGADVFLGEDVVILPTMPPDARLYSEHQPLHRIRAATHIRAMVHSVVEGEKVASVRVEVDGEPVCEMVNDELADTAHRALWTCRAPWASTPSLLIADPVFPESPASQWSGLHEMTIIAVTEPSGGEFRRSHMFSLDGTTQFQGVSWPQLHQHADWTGMWRGLLLSFIALWFVVILGGGRFQLWRLERASRGGDGDRLAQWVTKQHGKMFAEHNGFSDSDALAAAVPNWKLMSRCRKAFELAFWQLELWQYRAASMWRSDKPSAYMMTAIGVMYLLPFTYLGPINGGSWAAFGIYGLFADGQRFDVRFPVV